MAPHMDQLTFFLNDPHEIFRWSFPILLCRSRTGRSEVATVALDDSITMTGRLFLQISNSAGVSNGATIEIQSGFDGNDPPVIVSLPETSQNGFLYAVLYVEGMLYTFPTWSQRIFRIEYYSG